MIRIRLARFGKKNDPFFKIVAIEKTKKREGKAVDFLGYYYPLKNDLKIESEKIEKWLKNGAKISEGVKRIIQKNKNNERSS